VGTERLTGGPGASFLALAKAIAATEATSARERFAAAAGFGGDPRAIDLATLLACAYPSLAPTLEAHAADVIELASSPLTPREARDYKELAAATRAPSAELSDEADAGEGMRARLRRLAYKEKLRVAARELLPEPTSDVDVTARELADLADACLEAALGEALAWATRRFGEPRAEDGSMVPFAVIGMGKLGGRELNAGSDVDLILFYETDEGGVVKDGAATDTTLHEYFARVAQRFIATMEENTADGIVWRVDMRLRPEGSRGPLVNALGAAERYYESWGRTWERAALVRARASAGDIAFGERVLAALHPFVWRRVVDPAIADEMIALLLRARTEIGEGGDRDLKLGPGGIREAEFFAQSLQLVWGGREPTLHTANTLDALRRLHARGLVTDREAREVGDAYLLLRRLEHRVQFATGLQTHAMPEDAGLAHRIARSLGFGGKRELEEALGAARAQVETRLHSLATRDRAGSREVERAAVDKLLAALDTEDEAEVHRAVPPRFGDLAARAPDLARHLLALARRPDAPLGTISRERHPELAYDLVDALLDAADPEQATRLMAAFFARFLTPSVYVRALAQDPRATRRLASVFGASAFLGNAAVAHPELVDRVMFGTGAPDPESARRTAADEVSAVMDPSDTDAFVGALRRAKGRVIMEVGLADLAGELDRHGATLTLSALADVVLEHATRFALAEKNLSRGLAVLAMGKLGGREIGYGSDLDLFFVYDGAGLGDDAEERFIRIAQRVLRLVGAPHGDGPGYELDTRLRPSGNQGLLVVSIDAFERYHARSASSGGGAEDWERQALVKARFSAGDAELGARVIEIAHREAYERGEPAPDKVHHLRMRLETELGQERRTRGRARYDLKLGRGGLVDVEFAVQWLQMKHGKDVRVRSTDTESALDALETHGYLAPKLASALRDGYRMLRQIEQRSRVHHGSTGAVLEEGSPGLGLLARRVGMRDGPRASASEALLAGYAAMTETVRAAYLAVLGISP
jgi:[glutamine synthetase] adenylyltransferase / [glutamine synthetase]-adenylyl-L-tyrosine phosphorylase